MQWQRTATMAAVDMLPVLCQGPSISALVAERLGFRTECKIDNLKMPAAQAAHAAAYAAGSSTALLGP